MASVAEVIPAHLLRPERKAEVIEWIKATRVPYRFRRKLLQDWGERVGLTLTAADYRAVTDWKGTTSLATQRT